MQSGERIMRREKSAIKNVRTHRRPAAALLVPKLYLVNNYVKFREKNRISAQKNQFIHTIYYTVRFNNENVKYRQYM